MFKLHMYSTLVLLMSILILMCSYDHYEDRQTRKKIETIMKFYIYSIRWWQHTKIPCKIFTVNCLLPMNYGGKHMTATSSWRLHVLRHLMPCTQAMRWMTYLKIHENLVVTVWTQLGQDRSFYESFAIFIHLYFS